jgi:hypothetical protein
MSARNSTGFGVVERAAAETAALRRVQNDLGNTPPGEGAEALAKLEALRGQPRGAALRGHFPGTLFSFLFPGRFPAQVFLFGGVNADYFAVGDEQRNHDLEASFELRLLP